MVTRHQKELARKTYLKHRGEAFARSLTRQAWLDGRIVKTPCEICGNTEVQAHHDDYNKPLEVRWMCTKCHKQWHLHNNPIRPRHERKCIICGREFKFTKYHKKYCSEECRYKGMLANNRKSNRKHYRPSTGVEQSCKECNKIFISHKNSGYCSQECRKIARLRQKREEYERNKSKYRAYQKRYRTEKTIEQDVKKALKNKSDFAAESWSPERS